MSGKFMSVKKYIIPTITMVIIASQLMGCAAASSDQLVEMLNRGEQIEIEVASPAFGEEEQGTESQILWEELASLSTNEVLRKAWDNTLKITVTDTGKNGMLYVNDKGENANNTTLRMALHNRAFQKLFESEDGLESLAEGALNNYADLDVDETYKAALMGINGYFNIIPDMEVNYANADSTLTRNEFLAMVFRAESPVSELTLNADYVNAVGQSDYNIFAQGVVEDSYLDLQSKSLNNMTANGAITRAEVVYTLVKRYFSKELSSIDIKNSEITFTDAKDGGDIINNQKKVANPTSKDYWKSYELTYALSNPDDGLPTDLYKALLVARQIGILQTNETRWDEAVTRSEVIDFLMNAYINDSSIETFNFNQGTIIGYEVPVDEPTTQEPSKSEINDTDTQVADGVENENNVAPSVEETTVEETPADSNSDIILEYPENDTYTLTASDIEMLRFFGATESEINSIHSLQEFDNLLVRLLEAYENNSDSSSDTGSSSSGSGSGNTGGSEDAHDPSRVPQLGDHDIPGGM